MDTIQKKLKEKETDSLQQRLNFKLSLRKKKMDDLAASNIKKSISENFNIRNFNDKDKFEISYDELIVPQNFIQELQNKQSFIQKLEYLSNNYFNSDIQIKKYSVKCTFTLLNKIKKVDYQNISQQLTHDFINKLFALLFESNLSLQLLYTTSSIIGLIVYITPIFNEIIIRNAKSIMSIIKTHPDNIIKKQLLWIFNNIIVSGQNYYQCLVNEVNDLCPFVLNFISQLDFSSPSLYNVIELLPEIIWCYSLILEYDSNRYFFFEQKVYDDLPKLTSCLKAQTDFNLYYRAVNFFHIFLRLFYELNFEDNDSNIINNINLEKLESTVLYLNIPQKLIKFFGEYMPIESQRVDNDECMQNIAQQFIYLILVTDSVLDVLINNNLMIKLQYCFDSFKERKYKAHKYNNFLLLYLNIIDVANENLKYKYYKTIICDNSILKTISELYFKKVFVSKSIIDIIADIYYSIFESEKMINMCIANLLVWKVPNLFAEVLKDSERYNISSIEKIGKCLVSIFKYGEQFGEEINPMIEYLRNENIEETLKLISNKINSKYMDISWCDEIIRKYYADN